MKVIFLDIDGVLNSEDFILHRLASLNLPHDPDQMIDPEAVSRLNQITDRTGAMIVVSSTWRLRGLDEMRDVLVQHGVTGRIIDITPDDLGLDSNRGDEIQAWLEITSGRIERFVILDDDRDMNGLMPFLVRTSWSTGLLDEHVQNSIELLEREIALEELDDNQDIGG